MRWQQVQRLLRNHLEPDLEAFKAYRRQLIKAPVGWLLHEIGFGESGWETGGFYVEAFVQPLFVPRDVGVMTYGHRIGGGAAYWEVDADREAESMSRIAKAIRKEGLPLLDSLSTVAAFAKVARKEARRDLVDYYSAEEAGSGYVLLGRVDEGRRWLEEARRLGDEADSADTPWAGECRDRAVRLLGALDTGGAEAAREILLEWRAYTAEQLKIPADWLAEDPDTVDLR